MSTSKKQTQIEHQYEKFNQLLSFYGQSLQMVEIPAHSPRATRYQFLWKGQISLEKALTVSQDLHSAQALAWLQGAQALFLPQTYQMHMAWNLWLWKKIEELHRELVKRYPERSGPIFTGDFYLPNGKSVNLGPESQGYPQTVYLEARNFNVYLRVVGGMKPLQLYHQRLLDPIKMVYGWDLTALSSFLKSDYTLWLANNQNDLFRVEDRILKVYGYR